MKLAFGRRASGIAAVGALALVLTACASGAEEPPAGDDAPVEDTGAGDAPAGDYSSLSGELNGSGASSMQNAMGEWTIEFPALTSGAVVNYNAVGSGQGRSDFLSGASAFAGSDAAMDDEEYAESQELCGPDGAFHVPTAVLPIAVAANLPGVTELNLDADTIAGIFSGEISTWDDEAITSQNEGAELSGPITVVHRADESGTTENFTEYLAAAAPDVWEWEASGDWPEDITAESAEGTTGVVEALGAAEGAVTYADAGQVTDASVTANVEVGGEYTELTPEAAGQAIASSTLVEGQAPNNMAFELDRETEEAGVYPIIQVAYTIWCNQYADQATADLARGFASYVTSEEGQNVASEAAGSSPLTPDLITQAQESISQITAG